MTTGILLIGIVFLLSRKALKPGESYPVLAAEPVAAAKN